MSPDAHEGAECTAQTMLASPTQLVTEFREAVPRFVDRGRSQAALVRTVGRFAVRRMSTLAERGLTTLPRPSGPLGGLRARAEGDGGDGAGRSRRSRGSERNTPERPAQMSSLPRDTGGVDPATLAIHDYDSLAASQVVARLNGLESEELEAVRRYENATRGRKTILNKIAQLQR